LGFSKSASILRQGIDRSGNVVRALWIEQFPGSRLLYQPFEFRERADGQREPGLQVFEDLVGETILMAKMGRPVRNDTYIESRQTLYHIPRICRRKEMHPSLQTFPLHQRPKSRLKITVPTQVQLGRIELRDA
jgi:hypothetical protein